jgi:hypothetical protein
MITIGIIAFAVLALVGCHIAFIRAPIIEPPSRFPGVFYERPYEFEDWPSRPIDRHLSKDGPSTHGEAGNGAIVINHGEQIDHD